MRDRRRHVFVAISVLLVLSTLPIFGHHLPVKLPTAPAPLDHLGAFCMVALRYLLSPVHGWFHVLTGVGLAYAAIDRLKGWLSLRQSLGLLDGRPPVEGDPVWNASMSVGIDPQLLTIVRGLPNPAFTAGAISPRIFVAANLAQNLTRTELECVLAHEAAHVDRRDPLRLSVYRFLACTLFWIPALKRLAQDMADEIEILADDIAGRGRPLVMASAILALADAGYGRSIRHTAGFHHPDLLDRRVRRLAGEVPPVATHLTKRAIAGAGLALALVLASGTVAAQPEDAAHATHAQSHCNHTGGSVFSHLVCSGCHSGRPSHCSHKV